MKNKLKPTLAFGRRGRLLQKGLPLVAALSALAAGSARADMITFTSFLANDGHPGVGASYDLLDASWSELLSFSQFNMTGKQLNSARITYNLFLEIDQSASNTATRRNSPASAAFSIDNSLDGGLTLGGSSLISLSGGHQVNSASVPKNSTKDFDPFIYEASSSVLLSGAALAPFMGSGTIDFLSYGNANSTPLVTPLSNFAIWTLAYGNGSISVQYDYSQIPTPTPPPPVIDPPAPTPPPPTPPTPPTPPPSNTGRPVSNVPETGNSLAMLGSVCAGFFGISRRAKRKSA